MDGGCLFLLFLVSHTLDICLGLLPSSLGVSFSTRVFFWFQFLLCLVLCVFGLSLSIHTRIYTHISLNLREK